MKSKRALLFILFAVNFMNYMDRQVISGVAELIKKDFVLNDAQMGVIAIAFLISYSLLSVPAGIAADKWNPAKVASVGVIVWSIATVMTSTAQGFNTLFFWRALTGVGEAAFVCTAPTIIGWIFSDEERSGKLSVFNLGLPFGGAAGVVLGSKIGELYGWHMSFVAAGLPGLLLAYALWKLPVDEYRPASISKNEKLSFGFLANPVYLLVVLGYAGISWTFGSVAFWMPAYFSREWGMTLSEAGLYTGALQVAGGLFGAIVGGYVADYWYKRDRRGRAYSLFIACALSGLSIWAGLAWHSIFCFFLACFFMMWHIGVAQAMILDCTPQAMWSTASAAAILLMHAFGDIPGPVVTGYFSDKVNLGFAVGLLPIAVLIAAGAFLAASHKIAKQVVSGQNKNV
jgi:MFS family permease